MSNYNEMDEINALLNEMREEEPLPSTIPETVTQVTTENSQDESNIYEEINAIFGEDLGTVDEVINDVKVPTPNSTTAIPEEETLVETEILNRIGRVLGIDYSPEQRKIIRHAHKPLNVISCAGSGKTTVLIAKMFYRELFYNISPDNMLAITFNNKASYEIKVRYQEGKKLMRTHGSPEFKTYHALFLMLIRNIHKYRNLEVINQEKYTFQLYRLINVYDGDIDKSDILQAMFSLRSYLINNGISSDGIENYVANTKIFTEENYMEVITAYNKLKEDNQEIDFDDMMILLKHELEQEGNHKIISTFRSLYQDIYIDEYQDISNIQLEILNLLIGDFNRLVVIGDDDQSIYSFRGSNPIFIKDFTILYPNAERLYLSQNYRCKSNILNPVIHSINQNINRVPKNIEAFNDGGNVFYSDTDSYNDVCKKIQHDTYGLQGNEYANYAILVRTNSLRMFLTDMLIENGVQVDIGNNNYSLRNNKVYKVAMGILKAIKNRSNKDFAEYGYPLVRFMSKYEREGYKKNFTTTWYDDVLIRETVNIPSTVKKIIKEIDSSHSVSRMIAVLWKHMKSYYSDLEQKGFGSLKKAANVYRYLSIIGKGIPLQDFISMEYSKEVLVQSYLDNPCAIKIHTFHTVKGLEFNNVYMIGLNNDIIPDETRIEGMKRQLQNEIEMKQLSDMEIRFAQNQIEEYIEEERRLFYVAWTRAKDNLTIHFNSDSPSRFISNEINVEDFTNLATINYDDDTEDDYEDYM